jgi:hypothetical protein
MRNYYMCAALIYSSVLCAGGMDLPVMPVPAQEGKVEEDTFTEEIIIEPEPEIDPVTFFGEEIRTKKISILIDASGSMRGKKWEALKNECIDAISFLDENIEFNVHSFASGYSVELLFESAFSSLVKATPKNKRKAIAWLHTQHPGGGTPTGPAVVATVTLDNPDDLILFTDGVPSGKIEEHETMIVSICGGDTRCHAYGINDVLDFQKFLIRIAGFTNGIYVHVSIW